MHKCTKEDVLEMMREDTTEIKADVKKLLAFKWKIYSVIVFTCAIVTFLLNYLMIIKN